MSTPARRWPAYCRLPDFLPVPMRGRRDGWAPLRQGDFIGFLAETGSVAEAARRVGLSRESAYRLRRRRGAEGFAFVWDAALVASPIACARKVTAEEAAERAFGRVVQVRMRRGRYVGSAMKACSSMLLRHLDRLDRHRLAKAGDAW